MENVIRHISDTAFWIAAFRAQESERPDAILHDPLAAKLAGEKGKEMLAQTPGGHLMAFAMVMRTLGIDGLVEDALGRGVDTIINLGAGLDTRPYRLKLPEMLSWIEVDYPELIDYKNKALGGDKPVCKLRRIGADLSSVPERRALFGQLGAQAGKALVITEGVIGYLSDNDAAALARDLRDIATFTYWIQDFAQGRLRKHRNATKLKDILKHTPHKFTEGNPLRFFGKLGWRVAALIYILDQADRVNRRLPPIPPWSYIGKIFPRLIRRLGNKTYGYVMFEKA